MEIKYKYSLKDVFLGINNGQKEALLRDDFEKYFYDHENIIEQVLSKEKFLVLGKKGSGKTILAEYLKKTSKSKPDWFVDIRPYKEFEFHKLINLKSSDVSPNEYISLWEWVILLDLARNCLKDNGISRNDLQNKLEKFYKENYYSIDIDSKKIVEITSTNNIKGEILKQTAQHNKEITFVQGSYLNYLESLREVVIGLLKSSKSKYLIFYDELDDRFVADQNYKDCILSLIKAADKINMKLIEFNIDAKLIILLRTDIFSILNDPDLNKIKMVSSLLIDWGNYTGRDSPLFSLVLSKIKKSIPELENINNIELFEMFFPQDVRRIPPSRYLLERTFFRPRDVITYLNLIIDKYPNSQYFGWKGFIELKKAYSEYFFDEVRNELSGHLSDIQIDETTLFLKQFNLFKFDYTEIKEYYEKNKKLYSNIDLDSTLKIFFKFNIIGNRWYNPFKKRDYYSWSYRDNRAQIDYNKGFVVHLGLREELSL
jgi:hypothetical protein